LLESVSANAAFNSSFSVQFDASPIPAILAG
jgi:hypothetical protein